MILEMTSTKEVQALLIRNYGKQVAEESILTDWRDDYGWVNPEKCEHFGLSYVEKERHDVENNNLRESHFYFGLVGNEVKVGPEFTKEDYENSVGVHVHWEFYRGETTVSINKAINNFTTAQRAPQ